MNRSCPSTSRPPSSRTDDEPSADDYQEALCDIDQFLVQLAQEQFNAEQIGHSKTYVNIDSSQSSLNTADWEESNSLPNITSNIENCLNADKTSSQGMSPNTTNVDEAFHFGTPEVTEEVVRGTLQEEQDFMAFVMSFPHRVPSELLPLAMKKPQTENAKIGLDHLDNLCKLMEQISELKETNHKLKRRVQYLEDIKTLHEIHKEMVDERKLCSSGLSDEELQQMKDKLRESVAKSDDNISLDYLEAPSEEHLYNLCRSKTAGQIGEQKCERGHKSRSSTINKERRERSKSVGHPGHAKNKKRPSRWSKVKEVLGIEKSDDASGGGNESQPTSDGRKSLKSEDNSKAYKLSCSKSHSNVLSSRSFSEAERQKTSPTMIAKKSDTLDPKTAQAMMEQLEKEEMSAKKSPKTPWGKMKTMIQIRRDNRQQKSESSSSSPRDIKPNKSPVNGHSPNRRNARNRPSHGEIGLDSERNDLANNHRNGKNHSRLDVEYPKEGRHRQKSSPHKHSSRKSSAPHLQIDSKSILENELELYLEESQDSTTGSKDSVSTKENGKRKKSKTRPPPLEYTDDPPSSHASKPDDLEQQPTTPSGLSPTAQRKWVWSKVKDVLKKSKRDDEGTFSVSAPSSPAADALTFDFDLENVQKDEEDSISSAYPSPRGSDVANPMLLPSNASPSTTVTELLRELQQNLSDDFNKKLEEWQRCRTEGIQKMNIERKDSFGERMRKISKTEKKFSAGDKDAVKDKLKGSHNLLKKDLCWLKKEQQKVDREILRLSKEKQKFEKRSSRLKQLKEAMMDGQKKEVLVKTSAGEFRFEGISDAFTKKLYEWETKKGVNPELSTIALLDESLKPPVDVVLSTGSNSTRTSPEPSKCFQVSRASSEPDLSTAQKDTNNQTLRSKSGDTLLGGELVHVVATSVSDLPSDLPPVVHHTEDSYYSLLEENMYLLDQLKEKEEICCQLQNELERLDDRTETANRTHQEEMEKYRQKLWEIHMSRPRDLQGSLHLITELKSRIDELQKCSDKLKSDRERLEESFRYHSNQQARLADDLIRKVREMQVNGVPYGISRGSYRRKWRKTVKCDPNSITRIHDLSTQLLQQTRDVEQTLMERTRQVCHLRWELLHRDMSAVLLQAALHRVTSQGEPLAILPTWDKRRTKFKNAKAWSVDTTSRRLSEDLVTDDWLQERLRQLSLTPYNDWSNLDFCPSDLMTTAHELKKEALRISLPRTEGISDSEEKKSARWSIESEPADSDRCYDTGSAFNSRSSSLSSGGQAGGLRVSHSDTRLYERIKALRRHSSSSVSCAEASDSSSLHESDRIPQLFGRRPHWRSLDNVSSSCSSRSSILDDDIRSHWRQMRSSSRGRDVPSLDEGARRQLQKKYGSFRETDEDNEERIQASSEWGNQCLITPKPIHLARISDTESDKNRFSPVSYIRHDVDTSSPDSAANFPTARSRTFFDRGKLRGTYPSFRHHESHRNATDGSVESLDKYETAIRDEELTISDRQFVPHQLTSASQSHSMFQPTYSDVTDTQQTDEEANQTCSGTSNILKFKYKGTKGFGKLSRTVYEKMDPTQSSYQSLKSDDATESFHLDV